MMRLRQMGSGTGGNSSSSTSNLSALAPPFTAHRLNPKPNSGKPLFQYSESPYTIEPSTNWQFGIPSAPVPEVGVDSTGIMSVPLSDEFNFSAPVSVSPSTRWGAVRTVAETSGILAYVDEVEPYYSHYVPRVDGEGGPLTLDVTGCNSVSTSRLSSSSEVDHTRGLLDLNYGPQWDDSLRSSEGKWAKGAGVDAGFSSESSKFGFSDHKYQFNQGGHGFLYGKTSNQDSGSMYKNFNQLSEREADTGSLCVELAENKSCFEHNFGYLPCESNKTCISASSSTYPESHSTVLSCEMNKNFLNYRNSCSPYEKCVRPVDSSFTNHVSVVRSSPTVVMRPPTPVNHDSEQSIVSGENVCNDDFAGVRVLDSYHCNFSKWKDSALNSSFEIQSDSCETNISVLPKQGYDQILVSSTSVKEPPSCGLHSKDTLDRKARMGSQSPDINDSGGVGMASGSVLVINSDDGSKDIIDHHNPAVDSPCWRGAPSSQFSLFDIEAGNANHVVKMNLDEHCVFDHDKYNNLQSSACSLGAFSGKNVGEGNKIYDDPCARNGVIFKLGSNLDAICPLREESSLDDTKSRDRFSTMTSSQGVQISDEPNIAGKESGLLNNLDGGIGMQISSANYFVGADGAVMTLNDVSEGGAVAVHAAEKVLNSPSSQEDVTDHAKLPEQMLNVSTVIKAMHNLSELLLCHLSNYTYGMEEENTETLKYTISNLNSCLSKKFIHSTNEPRLDYSFGDTSKELGESDCMGTLAKSSDTTHEASNSCIQLDYQCMRKENINHSFPGKKDEKSPVCASSRDELDITRDDDMIKAIKKVLDVNFHSNEEMPSHSLLFKSLWLEAEAKLCSISCKARFDRMKAQMEKLEPQSLEYGIAEMSSQVRMPPGPNTTSKPAPKAHDGTIPEPSIQDVSITSTSGHGGDMEPSIMARFNILKSREANMKPMYEQEEQPHEVVELVDPIMARYDILKSREVNLKSNDTEEEPQPEKADGESGWYLDQCIGGQSGKTSNVALEIHFPTLTGTLTEGKCDSCTDNSGYEAQKEHIPATNDLMTLLFNSSRMTDKHCSGSCDSSSSDWEHVMKDDVAWRNS